MKNLLKLILLIIVIIIILFFMRSCESTKPFFDEACNKLGLNEVCEIGLEKEAYNTHHELCPPTDGTATIRPRFFPLEKEGDLWVSYGNFSNQHDEIFSVKVAGKQQSAINKYTAELKICADVVLLNQETSGTHQEDPASDEIMFTDRSDSSEQNLFIELDFVGKGIAVTGPALNRFVTNLRTPIKAPLQENIANTFEGDGTFVLVQSLDNFFKSPEADHAIDFIIDPEIDKNVFHDYYSRCRKYAKFIVKTTNNKTSGYLYRSGVEIRSSKNIVSSTPLWKRKMYAEHSGNQHKRYDAGVFGESNASHYLISGTWVTGSRHGSTNKKRGSAYGC